MAKMMPKQQSAPDGQQSISDLTIAYGVAANQLGPLATAMLTAYAAWQMNPTDQNLYQAWINSVNALANAQAAVDAAWAALQTAIQQQGG
jgi:hypothetical protein